MFKGTDVLGKKPADLMYPLVSNLGTRKSGIAESNLVKPAYMGTT